jgi:type I restriction enzyme, S subunit
MNEELPSGWRYVVLSDVAESWLGKMLDRQKHTAGNELPYLRNQNVRWFGVDLSDVSAMFFEDRELDRYGLRTGDVLVCEGGEPGRAAIWDGRSPAMKFQKAIHRVRPSASLLPEWLVFHLFHDAQSGGLERYFTGTTIKHFTGTALAKYEIPLPPPNEQRRIVAKLEALQARSRRASEALDAVPPLLEKLRQSILAAAFRGDLTKDWRAQQKNVEPATELLKRIRTERRQKWESTELAKLKSKGRAPANDSWKAKYKEPEPVDTARLPDLPEGWCWANVGLLAWSIKDGPHHSPKYSESGVPFISGRNVRPEGIDFSSAKFISEELNAEYAERCKPELNDVLYTKGGTTGIARVNTYDFEFNVWVHVAVLKFINAIVPFYAQHVLNSPHCYEQAQILTHGVGNQDLGLTRMVNITVPLAPKDEQVEIVRLLDAWSNTMSALSASLESATRNMDLLERAMLAKAFRGELVPQDPNDEPAEAMLARARSTNGSAPADGTPQKRGRARSAQRADQPND